MYEFGPEYRIKSKSDIQTLVKSGNFLRFGQFNVLVKQHESDVSKVAISVSKKSGNAVVRNKVKRNIREHFRCSELRDRGFRLLFMLKKQKIDLKNWSDFSSTLSSDFNKLESRLAKKFY
jgi:ribonuclease P protein component